MLNQIGDEWTHGSFSVLKKINDSVNFRSPEVAEQKLPPGGCRNHWALGQRRRRIFGGKKQHHLTWDLHLTSYMHIFSEYMWFYQDTFICIYINSYIKICVLSI